MNRNVILLVCCSLAIGLGACSSPKKPPLHWQQGGSTLEIPRARWVRGDAVIELARNGAVYVDGDHALTVDRAGRVYEPDGAPVALLEANGRLVGPDEEDLGVVGSATASQPGHSTAWLGLLPSGELVVYGSDGERMALGVWLGCDGSPRAAQACMVVSHLLARELKQRAEQPAVTFGVGVGVGF